MIIMQSLAFDFIDDEAARLGLIKTYNPTLSSSMIIMQCLAFDFAHDSLSWYARVPTAANLSDEPSRMLCKVAVGTFGATVVRPVGPEEATSDKVLESGLYADPAAPLSDNALISPVTILSE